MTTPTAAHLSEATDERCLRATTLLDHRQPSTGRVKCKLALS